MEMQDQMNNQQPENMTPNQPDMQTPEHKSGVGAFIGSIIIIILLLLAGWYFYNQISDDNDAMMDEDDAMMMEKDPQTPEDLDEDLADNNPFDAIQMDLENIDAEFEADSQASAQ